MTLPVFLFVWNKSILVKSPDLPVLAENEILAVECFYSHTYVAERLEAEGVFHDGGVLLYTLDGNALHEKAVTDMLEVPEYFALANKPEQRHGARETHVLSV